MQHYEYQTHGVCSKRITFDMQDGILHHVKFYGGCNGNTQGLSRLVEGMPAAEAMERLRGVNCGGRGTSCPDQLAVAIREALEK